MKLDELWLKTRRGVLYALYLIGALLVQNVILSHVALFGVRAMFLPALVVAAALFEGGWGGGLFGLAAGILSVRQDRRRGSFVGLSQRGGDGKHYSGGFIAGFLGDFYLNKRLFTYCIMGAAALFLAAFAQMFSLLFYEGQSSAALWVTALLQTLWSLPFLFPSYYLCKNFPWRSLRDVPTPYK